MKRHELVALMPGAGPPAAPPGCKLVAAGGHVAVLARTALMPLAGRADVVRAAAARAAVLEVLMPHGTVLPALPGQQVAAGEVADLIAANLPLLEGLALRLAKRAQFQVTVRWAEDRAAAAFGLEAQALPAFGAALAIRMMSRLSATGAELAALPLADGVLSNCALLIEREAEPALDAAVEEIDGIWSEGLTIRVVGPYPAVTFASLVFDRKSRAAVRDARAAFGLPADISTEGLRSARRRVLMSASPDRREDLASQAELLACLGRLGRRDGPVHVGRVWSDGMSAATLVAARAA